jgi:hypothetical protein
MKVQCHVEELELEGDRGMVPSVELTCSRCDHKTESYGTSGASIRRCLAMMREECPYKEENYYVADEDEGDV